MDNVLTFKGICAMFGGVLGYFFGGFDGFFYAILTLVIIDYATGIVCGIVAKELSSEIGARGIAKKVFIFALIGVANIIDIHALGENGVLRTSVMFFYMANEAISITENAARLGLPVPEKLAAVLAQLRSKDEDKPPGGGEG